MEEVITHSWGSRLKQAFFGILGGFILLGIAVFLAFWNERNGLKTAQSLDQAQQVLITVPSAPIDPKNNLKVVYTSGQAITQDWLTDDILGTKVNALSLIRQAQMFQWKENVSVKYESQPGGSEREIKSYTYERTWEPELINSGQFKDQSGHQNPSRMPIHSHRQYAQKVTLGDFTLPPELIKQIDVRESIKLSEVNLSKLEQKFNKPVSLKENELYLGANPENPQIGDLKVSLEGVLAQPISLVAQQSNNTFQAYQAPAGRSVMLLSSGEVSANQLFENAKSQNKMTTWILRAVSLFMMIGGFALILKPLVILADVLPFLGRIVGFGTGVISFILGLSLWLIITAIAWFATRPLLSIILIAIVVLGVIVLMIHKKNTVPPPVST